VDIPFNEIGITPEHGKKVVQAIREFINAHPGDSVSMQKIVEKTAIPGPEVKEVFFALLTLRYLKPSFLPRHTLCETAIGLQERSVDDIQRKLDDGLYPSLCTRCHEEIAEFSDLEIEIIFWEGRGDLNV
jgi:hypothetical protein